MSTEHDLLRRYAHERATINLTNPATGGSGDVPIGPRDQFAGKAFVALQNVLDLLPEIEEKNGVPHVAEKVRDAIRKGLS